MFNFSETKSFAAIVSILTIGTVLSFGVGTARAGDDVTEDQIVRALTPEKKPLTRGLSVGPQTSPAVTAEQSKFVASVRGYAPPVAIEFARKLLFAGVRPNFTDLEAHLKGGSR